MQLQTLTNTFRSLAQQAGKPPIENELSGLLARGKFDQAGSHVLGTWPIAKALLLNLTSGI